MARTHPGMTLGALTRVSEPAHNPEPVREQGANGDELHGGGAPERLVIEDAKTNGL